MPKRRLTIINLPTRLGETPDGQHIMLCTAIPMLVFGADEVSAVQNGETTLKDVLGFLGENFNAPAVEAYLDRRNVTYMFEPEQEEFTVEFINRGSEPTRGFQLGAVSVLCPSA